MRPLSHWPRARPQARSLTLGLLAGRHLHVPPVRHLLGRHLFALLRALRIHRRVVVLRCVSGDSSRLQGVGRGEG